MPLGVWSYAPTNNRAVWLGLSWFTMEQELGLF